MRMGWEIILSQAFLVSFLATTIRLAVPILIPTLGEIFAQKSGVLNLGIEGMMITGALGAFLTSYYTGNPWLGVLSGLVVGGLFGLLHAFMTITLSVNQVLTGLAIFILGPGLAGFIFRTIFGVTLIPPITTSFTPLHIPLLSKIPVLGPVLFQQNILVYLAFIFVPICGFILFKTAIGLKITGAGENPRAADTLGVNVYRIRYLCVIFGGVMAGFGGAFMALSTPGQTFMEYMIGGRGWIAVALVIFAKWNPYRALGGALLFGGADALQMRVQALGIGIPHHFLLMLPFVLTIVILVMISKGTSEPSALTIPYKRGNL